MSEFRIKVSCDLDTSDLKSQLNGLDKDYKINATLDITNITKQIQTLKKNFQNAFKLNSKDVGGLDKLIKTLSKLNKETSAGGNNSTKGITNLVKQYKELANTVSKLQKQLDKGGLGENAVDRTKTQMTDMLVQMQKIKSQMNEMEKMDIDAFNQKMDNKALIDMNNYISKIEASTASLQTKLNSISFDHIDSDVISKLTNKLEEIKATADKIDINFDMSGINEILSDLSRIQSEIKNLEKVENLASSFDKITSSANEAGVEIKDLKETVDSLSSVAGSTDGSFDRMFANAKNEASELKSEIKEVESAMKSTLKTSGSIETSTKKLGSSLLGTMDDFKGNFKQFTLAEVAGDFITDGIRTAVGGIKDTVVETDAAIIDLEKVYGKLSGEGLKTYLLDVTEVAKGTGQTSVDVIQGTAKAVQSGIKDINDALEFSRQSAMFSNVGDVDQEQADTMIASIMSAYGGVENALKPIRENIKGMGEDYSTLAKFTDLANYAGNNFAISTADVGVALQQSAAALQTNGVSMEQSVGMVTAMNEVLQDAGKTGNALKSISANLSGVAVSAKDGTLQSNKTAKALKEIANIDVWDKQTGQVKDMYQVMDELHGKWDELSEAEKNALGTTIAGKTQLNAFNALLGNWEKAKQLVSDYNQGLTIGSAYEENLAYLDSIQGKWNAIKENLKSIVTSLISSDMVKGFLDILEAITAKLAEFAATDFGKNVAGFATIATGLTAVGAGISKISGISKVVTALAGIGKTAGAIKTVAGSLGKLGTAATTAAGTSGGMSALSTALAGIGSSAAGIGAAAAAVVGLAVAIGDSTEAMSRLQDTDTGLLGDMVASGSEMMNGAVQSVVGTGWGALKTFGKAGWKLITGNISEVDDVFREGMAKVNTSLNEGLSDMTATTSTGLQLMKESTQDELSGVYDIYNNEFSRLPILTSENVEEMSSSFADKLVGMSDDSMLIAKGMGGEIGATVFKGIHEGMSRTEIREQLQSNLSTLLKSGIINEKDVEGIVNTFNGQFEKALDSNTSFKQAGTDLFNQIGEGLKNGGDWKDALQDASATMGDWTDEMIQRQASFGDGWRALMDGITADMTDKEVYKKMSENAKEYMEKNGGDWKDYYDQLRKEQQQAHKDIVDGTEDVKNKTKEQLQQDFESLDIETRVKLATEFENVDESQLAVIHGMLQRFPEKVQTTLKGEGFKEVLAEAESVEEFLQNLEEDKLIKIMSNIEFAGNLTPEELEVAVKRLPDEKIMQLLVQTSYLDGLTPEQLAIYLKELPEEKRVSLISQYIESGKRTPEQLKEALQTVPPEKIAQLILEYKEEGAGLEEVEYLLQLLPPEVRTVVKAIIEGKEQVESHKESVDKVPEEKTTKINVEETNPGKTQEVKEDLNEVDNTNPNSEITITSNDKGLKTTKEDLQDLHEKVTTHEVEIKPKQQEGGVKNWFKNLFGGKDESQTVEVKAEVTEVDTDGVSKVKVDPIKIKAEISEVDTASISKIKVDPIKISVEADTTTITNVQSSLNSLTDKTINLLINSSNATLKITNITQGLNGLTDKTVNLLINSSNAMSKIANVQNGLATISDKTIKILGDSSNAMLKIANVTQGLASIQDKTVKILADSSNAMLKIQRVTDGLASIPDRTVTIKVNSSQAISAINSVRSALASVKSKAVSLTVNKTVTESRVSQSSNGRALNSPIPMLTNSSLASIPVSASASPLSSTPVTISDSPSSLASVPVSAKANSFGGTLDASKILSSLDFDISHIKNLEEALERLGNQLDFLDEKAEATFGQEKVDLLQQQIPLLREQQKIQEQIAKNERAQNNELIYWLSNKGFTFDNLGNITNYNDKLLEMEQNVESLKKKHDELNNVAGDKKNESAVKSSQQAYESANDTLSKTKKYLEEYFATNNKEITEASKKWWEYENSIRDAEKAIRDLANAKLQNEIDLISEEIDFLDSKIENLNDDEKVQYLDQQNKLYREQQGLMHDLAEQMRGQLATLDKNSDEYVELQKEIINLSTEWWELESAIKATNEQLEEIRRNQAIEPLENSLQEVEYLLDRHSDRLDLIDAQYEKATGAERVEGLIKKEQILNEQLAAQEEAYRRIYDLAAGLQKDIWQFGFRVDENSLISNYDEVLNSLVGTDEYERAKEYADEYMEVVRGDLIDIQVEAYETQNAIKELAEEIQEALEEARQERLEPFKNSLEDVRFELDRVNDRLDLLNEANARSQGKTKIDYLYNQMDLLNEKVQTSQKEFSALYDLIAATQNDIWQYGFRVDENSLIYNYDDVLNDLVGTDKYENAKKVADEYMELMRDDYIENKLEILETQNAIKDLQDEIEKAERELALFSSTNRLKQLNSEFDELASKLDTIESKLEYAFGADKLNLMRKEIELLNDQLDLQSEKLEAMTEQAVIYTTDLSKYGFKFDADGSISNYEEIMELFKNDEQVEKIKELCEEYMDLQGEINDLSSEYADLENSVKDVYSEMLDTTQEIEREITEVIEKEYEKRKKELEDYTDERIKLLEKEKKAYQDMRDEQDYDKSIKEQTQEIEELNKRIEVAKRDTSIAGEQRLKELMEQLAEAQEKLEETTQDKIDSDYSDNIDSEIDKLEEEKESLIEILDEKFSEVNIAKMVAEALASGFIEINGEVKTLQDALLENINNSAEGYSVMAGVIKNELVANLNIAKSTMQELVDIGSKLNLQDFGLLHSNYAESLGNPNTTSSSNEITIGDTNIVVNGNVDSATLDEIEEMIKASQDEMLEKITKDL